MTLPDYGDLNRKPRKVFPVHQLPPRRYAGEGLPETPETPGRPSVDALACRVMLRQWRAARRKRRRREWGGPAAARRPGPFTLPPARKSRYRGVHWDRRRNLWRAEVKFQARNYPAGYSPDEAEAARKSDALEWRLSGDPRRLNFPLELAIGGVPSRARRRSTSCAATCTCRPTPGCCGGSPHSGCWA